MTVCRYSVIYVLWAGWYTLYIILCITLFIQRVKSYRSLFFSRSPLVSLKSLNVTPPPASFPDHYYRAILLRVRDSRVDDFPSSPFYIIIILLCILWVCEEFSNSEVIETEIELIRSIRTPARLRRASIVITTIFMILGKKKKKKVHVYIY